MCKDIVVTPYFCKACSSNFIKNLGILYVNFEATSSVSNSSTVELLQPVDEPSKNIRKVL